MSKTKEKISLIIVDFLTINLAFFALYLIRFRSGLINNLDVIEFKGLALASLTMYLFWFAIFFFNGLYKSWYLQSRFDEIFTAVKAISFGVLVVFIITVDASRPLSATRIMVVIYWFVMVFFFGIGRVTVHTFQRKLLQKGIGLKKALIVGCGKRAKELYNQIKVDSYLGYKTLGFIETGEENKYLEKDNGIEILGSIDDLKKVIPEFEVTDVLIALDESNHNKLFDIVQQCDDFSVTLKIVPDLYDIVRGQARTNQLYGIPLIEIVPEIMPEWERNAKRIVDIWVSFFVLIIFSPIWILVALLIKLESRGPVFYRQERVGKDGRIFLIYKFRSMVQDAEKRTGPVWAGKDDPRVTRIGKIIRKLRIDEIPQFINVLDGDMSLVGPRPERPFFVEKFKKELPLYDRRLKVRPGITGWAQVNGGYDMSIDDVKKKLQYDLFYIENMSLRLDLRILFNTVFVVLTGKGH